MTNAGNQVLYTGFTNDLALRCVEHRAKQYPNSFTARYNIDKLVYFEEFLSMEQAKDRERQIKGGNRKAKEELIKNNNPFWNDLFETGIGLEIQKSQS
jgi:putative endonuclease